MAKLRRTCVPSGTCFFTMLTEQGAAMLCAGDALAAIVMRTAHPTVADEMQGPA